MASAVRTTVLLHAPMFSNTPIPRALRALLLDRLWPLSGQQATGQDADHFEAYFAHFEQERSPAVLNHHAIQTFADFLTMLEIICGNPTASLTAIRSLVAAVNPGLCSDQPKLSASIELVVRLWLLVSVRITMPARQHTYLLEVSLPWPDNLSLADVLQRHLSQPPPPAASQVSTAERFSDHLNVVDMRKITGVRVLWTANLGEHLVSQDSCAYLFHHVAALKRIRDSVSCNAFLPPAFVDETLATINLLVPLEDGRCNAWLGGEIARLSLDDQLVYRKAANRSKRGFVFWQDRLLAFSDAFDRARPSGLAQWWHDRRDMGRWWNYWLVVAGLGLTVLFGLVQSVTGILQVIGVGGGGS
ncbi:hypothetical protein B0T24DRAFT_692682 [Lasiosphaeria ovina]|uniref:Uncharacterized protein n=1 Tax=Lasiosphaeria ovina TaxID=92902 RepID=A0AAE0JSH2_9PEZI|nr:hypothetical protein B0T24DRAFT_692682 [Lasiosphaeria ovina]